MGATRVVDVDGEPWVRPRGAVIVAHPDDETLWAGGMVLAHPGWDWTIVTLSRASDADRAPRFFRALQHLGAAGAMEDLDDGPDQARLAAPAVQAAVLAALARSFDLGPHPGHGTPYDFDLILTHGPRGEYTRHRRHEETSAAVLGLWQAGRISAGELWLFAYEDGGRRYDPRADEAADRRELLSQVLWAQKRRLITEIYGFAPESWEARIIPRTEAFWVFDSALACGQWARERMIQE